MSEGSVVSFFVMQRWIPLVFLSLLISGSAYSGEKAPCDRLASSIEVLNSFQHPDIPWGHFTPEDLVPALEKAVEQYKKDLDVIANNPHRPSAENTFLAEEEALENVTKIQSAFWNLWLTDSSPRMFALEDRVNDLVMDWFEFRSSHPRFLERVKKLGEPIYDTYLTQKGDHHLSDQIIYSNYAGMIKSGSFLPPLKRARVFQISRQLMKLNSEFVRNALKVRDSVRLIVRDARMLEGLSPEAIARAKKYAGQDGVYVFPVNDKFLEGEIRLYAKSRELRRKLWYSKTPQSVASQFITAEEAGAAWTVSNQDLITEITALHEEQAKLLGFSSFAAFQLDAQMVPGPQGVEKFFKQLVPRVYRAARSEIRELSRYAKKLDRIERLEEWDVPYYIQKLMKETYGFNDHDLSQYFELGRTMANLMRYAEKRFPIRFELKEKATGYHPDVEVYAVYDTRSGKPIAEIQLDPYRRPGKLFFKGWEFPLRHRGVGTQGELPASIAVSMNLEPSREGKPVLLDFEEGVQLAFHEFLGHALHDASDVSGIPSMSGTSGVFEDAVETPSMIAEEFARDPVFLRMAVHHQTGKPLPESWIRAIRGSLPKFYSGLKLLSDYRALPKAILDFRYGIDPPAKGEDFIAYEKRQLGKLNLFPESPYAPFSHEFLHHFGGGMECLYFSYLTGAAKGAFVSKFIHEYPYAEGMRFENYWNHVLAKSGEAMDINFLIEQFTGLGITLDAFFERYGF